MSDNRQANYNKVLECQLWWRIYTEIAAADSLPTNSWTSLEMKSQPKCQQGPAFNNSLWVEWRGFGGLWTCVKRTPRLLHEEKLDEDSRMNKATTYLTIYNNSVLIYRFCQETLAKVSSLSVCFYVCQCISVFASGLWLTVINQPEFIRPQTQPV